jgi:predicted Fe-Mo cluster-binding NifX family protein
MKRSRLTKAAFACWDKRIAPVFDTAGQIQVVKRELGKIALETQEMPSEELPMQKALRLVGLGVETLVCGAISRTLDTVICSYGIQVVPFVAGDLDEVIQAWLRGSLKHESFRMPGCRRLRGGRFKGMHSSGQEVNTMKGRGRGMSGGGGKGLGQRGRGRCRPDSPKGAGAVGYCVCPECGQTESHQPGVPCVERKCPKCGVAMIRQ